MKAKPFLQLDRVIHEKGRLAIMSALAASPAMAFTELRDLLEMTDGNLTSHMRTLQGVRGQQARLGMGFVQVLDDGHRLAEAIVAQIEQRHQAIS